MSEHVKERYVGEILMQTKEVPAKLWDVLITDQGFHMIYFLKSSVFEIFVMILVWFFTFWGAAFAGFDRFAGASLLLLVVAIYILNRYRIRNRWKRYLQMPFHKKLFSNQRNIHIPKKDIQRIVLLNKALIFATKGKTYRLKYFENLHKQYKNGIDPFEKRIEHIENKRTKKEGVS